MDSELQLGFYLNGKYCPPMAGGNGEGEGGGDPGGAAPAAPAAAPTGDSSYAGSETSYADTEPERTPVAEERPEEPTSGSEPAARPSALGQLTDSLLGGQGQQRQQQAPPPPAQQVQRQIAGIAYQHQMELRELQAHLQYLPDDQRAIAEGRWERLTAQREREIVRLERQQARAEIEPHNRDLAVSELIRLAQHDNPKLDQKAMRAHLDRFIKIGSSAESVLVAAQAYADDHRVEVLEQRKTSRADKMGGTGSVSGERWKGMSTLEKLTSALRDSDRKAGRR